MIFIVAFKNLTSLLRKLGTCYLKLITRPVGQAVKTPASHAGDGSSILPRVIKDSALTILGRYYTSCTQIWLVIFLSTIWTISSVG